MHEVYSTRSKYINTYRSKYIQVLRQFDELQSIKFDKTDIVAQAMELSSIPTDMNNNSDIVSQAMQMSNISSDIVMDF